MTLFEFLDKHPDFAGGLILVCIIALVVFANVISDVATAFRRKR